MRLLNSQKDTSRDSFIDVLRFLGLTLIILAHISAPNVLLLIRWFDVPLMVIVSGMSYGLSRKKKFGFFSYIASRIKRLLLPVWLFLLLFFLFLFLSGIDQDRKLLNKEVILDSFLLISGIGFVWVIRVFFIVSLIPPQFVTYMRSISSFLLIILLILFTGLNELLINIFINYDSVFLKDIILYIIPYCSLFILGNNLDRLAKRELLSIFLFVVIICLYFFYDLFFVKGHTFFYINSEYKYPPHFLYIAYGVLGSLLLVFCKKIAISIVKTQNIYEIVSFVSKNSLWIYLWHILPVMFFAKFGKNINWIFQYFTTYFIAILITFTQLIIINIICSKIKNEEIIKNLKIIFS